MWDDSVPPPNSHVKVLTLIPQNVTVGDGVFKEVIKLKGSLWVVPSQSGVFIRRVDKGTESHSRDVYEQRKDLVRTQRGGHLKARKGGLRGSQCC